MAKMIEMIKNATSRTSQRKCSFVILLTFLVFVLHKTLLDNFFSCGPGCQDSVPMSLPKMLRRRSSAAVGSGIGTSDDLGSSCIQNFTKFSHSKFLRPNESEINEQTDIKKILVMVGNYGYKHFGFGFGSEPFKAACCREPRCFLTPNRNLLPVQDFDAVVFHFRTLLYEDIPKIRSPHQMYLLFELEPSSYIYQNPSIFDGIFNLTWNFRQDADVTYRYGRALPRSLLPSHESVPSEQKNVAKGKSALAVWFVSRCSSISWRERFVENLQYFINIDIYGDCGPNTCSTANSNQCYEMAEKKYKFYLSFENSICKDYVTEKFFNILRYNIVPIVYGGADYKALAPPHSYIDALEFEDTKALSKYLLFLHSNDSAYNEYFKWKTDYFIPSYWGNIALNFCALCEKLHQKASTPSSYQDLSNYMISEAQCTRVAPISWWETIFKS